MIKHSGIISRNISNRNVSDLFAYLSDHDRYVYLDTSKPDEQNRQSLLFTQPLRQLQYRLGENRDLFFEQLSHYMGEGFYLAGWFGYEFFHDKLRHSDRDDKSLVADFGVYRDPKVFDHQDGVSDFPEFIGSDGSEQPYRLDDLLPSMGQEEYCRAIRVILDYIAAGDTYQVNYTFKFSFNFSGSVASFYRDLRRSQPVPYGCCIRSGDEYILSFSPELFFRAEPGRIIARPMKGTMARGRTGAEDEFYATTLCNDEKNRSENVMIVDLLRNDLSRLVEATGGGTVRVASLFDVERYKSVFQMTSTVVAERNQKNGMQPAEMIHSLFPCGSVTGAPKIRTMEIIDELERQPRGIYTGAIGYFSPDRQAVFNVPIRTIVLEGNRGEMGIGSGIVADSSPESEWQECLLKARFLTKPLPKFELIETILYNRRHGYLYLDDHLNRLVSSASYFDFIGDGAKIRSELEVYATTLESNGCYRIRMTLSRDGEVQFQNSKCREPGKLILPDELEPDNGEPVLIDFSEGQIDTSGPWVFHKTTRRESYNSAHEKAQADGLFDVLFCNERDEITEGCISNLFILKDGCYYTPPLQCGLLDGIMRKQLLAGSGSIPVREKILYRADLLQADRLFICNSVRGVLGAKLRKPS